MIIVQETNRYCHQYYAAKSNENPVPQHGILEEMFHFLTLVVKMGKDQCDTLKEYWSRDPICHAPFYSRVKRWNSYFHIYS
jgi:hypothetical protein